MLNTFLTPFYSKANLRLVRLCNRGLTTSRCTLAGISGLEKEPQRPIVKSQIPGPKSKKLFDELNTIQVRTSLGFRKKEDKRKFF
jgi:hypothetical protein